MLTISAASIYAQTTSFSAGGGVTFAVNVDSTGNDLFMQIKGPSTMAWIGLGQGSRMKGSNIFVIYSDSTGSNVTLSPRIGTGETTPQASTSQEVTLLSGSGISDGNMVANIKCTKYHMARMHRRLIFNRFQLRKLEWWNYGFHIYLIELDLRIQSRHSIENR